MGPIKQLAVIPFAGGLDTKTDPRLVQAGKLLQAQNIVFKQTGTLNRRWGYLALPPIPTGSLANLAVAGNELLAFDAGQNVYSYNMTTNAWLSRANPGVDSLGSVVQVKQKNVSIQRTTGQQVSPDCASLLGVDVYAWEDQVNTGGSIAANGIRYSVFDSATGVPLLLNSPVYSTSPLTTDIRPKVLPMPVYGLIAIIWMASGNHIRGVIINPATPTVVASTATSIVNSVGGFYDAAAGNALQADGSAAIVVYTNNAGAGDANSVTYSTLSSSLGVVNTYRANGVNHWNSLSTTGCISVAYESATGGFSGNRTAFWICAADNGSASVSCSILRFNSAGNVPVFSLAQVISQAAQLQTCTMYINNPAGANPTAVVYAEVIGTPINGVTTNFIVQNTCDSGGNLDTTKVLVRGAGLASKAFSRGVNVAFQSGLQNTYFTVLSDVTTTGGVIVAKSLSGIGGGLISSSDGILPECQPFAPGKWRYASLVKGSGLALLGVNATTLDFTVQNLPSIAAAKNELTTGGIVQSYDGQQFVEQNFHIYPEGIGLTATGADGSLGTGAYFYAAVYAWQDASGQVQYSTPSVATQVNVTATNHVSVVVPTLRLTTKQNVQILIYRTSANGLTLTLCTSASTPIYNDPTVDSVTYVDKASDASILSAPAMYTQPLVTTSLPVLYNSAPPACTMLASFDERVFVSGLDDPLAYQYSEQTVAGIPVQFSAFLNGRIDPDGGDITAIARMDDKLVFFKKTAIFFITGTGPDATGQGGGYSQPEFIPSGGVGCATSSSVVLIPAGIMFQSSNGWYLLDRGLNVTYKGSPVEAFNSLTVTSATLIPNQWVIWTTTSGTAVVYDYFYDQWSTFTNHPATAGVLYNGLYYWGRADGTVFQQTPLAYSDAGLPIQWKIMTAKIPLAQIQGYQRIYDGFLLGSYRGAGVTMTIGCAFDYQTAVNAMAVVSVDPALGIVGAVTGTWGTEPWLGNPDGSTVFQLRFDILRKCQAIQFVISDSQGSAGNEGFALSAITLNVGVKKGGYKVPVSKQFGVA